MEKIDYTKIRNDVVRSEICRLMSEMLDNPDKNGIYPTSKFMWEMETYILERLETAQHDDWLAGKLVIDLEGLEKPLYELIELGNYDADAMEIDSLYCDIINF